MRCILLTAGLALAAWSSPGFAEGEAAPGIRKAEVDYEQVELVFRSPMLTWDTRADTDVVRIEPALPCAWFWENDTTLACEGPEMERAVRGATTYRIHIGEGLWTQAGEAMAPTTVEAATERPEIDEGRVEWKDAVPTLVYFGSQKPDPASVASVLELTVDDARVPFSISPASDPAHGVFVLDVPGLATMTGTLRVRVGPGLRSLDGPLRGVQDKVLTQVRLGEPFRLRYVECEAVDPYAQITRPVGNGPVALRGCSPERSIDLVFSRPLDDPGLAALRAALPTGWTADQTDDDVYPYPEPDIQEKRGAQVSIHAQPALVEAPLVLPVAITSRDGAHLEPVPAITVSTTDLDDYIAIEPKLLKTGPGSAALPRVRVQNLTQRPSVRRVAIGERTQRERDAPALPMVRNVPVDVPLPPLPEDVREHGGLVLAGADNLEDYSYGVAVAPFAVAAREAGDGRSLVWASRWGEARGLADADVELLYLDARGRERVVARTRTDADGLAWLDVPEKMPLPRGDVGWLVRVARDGLRTVTPLAEGELDLPRTPHAWTERDDTLFFGVTDRVLYRPGDTVRYRVWWRAPKGNHLVARPAPERLELYSEDREAVLRDWPVAGDAQGAMSASLALPTGLEDGHYCIKGSETTDHDYYVRDTSGACFQVARHEAQPVWATIAADRARARTGDTLVLDAQAGFYSGGPAPGTRLELAGLLRPLLFEELYPRFDRYTFASSRSPPQGVELVDGASPHADAHGRARVRFRVPVFTGSDDAPIPLGRLEITAGAGSAGRATSNSAPAQVVVANHARYVGLATEGWWLAQDRDPVLDAVVVTAGGEPVSGVPLDVRIETARSPWYDDDDAPRDVKPEALGHCTLVAGTKQPCPFRAPKRGWYRFVASGADAAPATIVRWIGSQGFDAGEDLAEAATLEVVQAFAVGTPARVRLRQPYAKALGLFVLEYEGVRHAWSRPIDGHEAQFDIPLQVDWAPAVTLRVLVRNADGDATAFATPTLGAAVDLAIARPDVALKVDLAPAPAHPGQELVVRLSNDTGAERHATVVLVDDSVHQQASEMWPLIDPKVPWWLGTLDDWAIGDWYALEAIERLANPFFLDRKRRRNDDGSSSELDSIVVTGTRIRSAEEMFEPGMRTQPMAVAPRTASAHALARVRQNFPDTAYWNPDVVVPAGESRELRVALPDNLTRWRALVWTSDAGDGFALTEATVASELPVELRLGVPARLFPGDRALATVAARNHADAAATLALSAQADGAGVHVDQHGGGLVAAAAETTQRVVLAPIEPGSVQLVARAAANGGADAVAADIPVPDRAFADRLTQVGWIDADTLSLRLPTLPEGAVAQGLEVEARQGLDGWLDGWLVDLRDYPHRCWEQSLTRAYGAAIADALKRRAVEWPEAETLVASTITQASGFQGDDGRFHFFSTGGEFSTNGNPQLSAWTLRAFDGLRALGKTVPTKVYDKLAGAVQADAAKLGGDSRSRWEAAAVASGALRDPGRLKDDALRTLWGEWDELSWYGRSELVRALARKPGLATQAHEGLLRLRGAGERHGLRQVVDDGRDWSWAMGSSLRGQCAIVATLFDLDADPAGEAQRFALLRGVADLYAGATPSLDTQASIHCVLAMRAAMPKLPRGSAEARAVEVALGDASATLAPAGAVPARHVFATPFEGDAVQVRGPATVDATLNVAASLDYTIDALAAPAQAVGMRLERRYDVLRQGKWSDVADGAVREGDWVRVTLRVTAPDWRRFVAITDPVPGGLVTRDLGLAGIADAALRDAGDTGSVWFDARRTGATDVRLYAQSLPPGVHEVHYFAQAVHPGDFLAPPAIAELMYGRGSRATTRGQRLKVGVGP